MRRKWVRILWSVFGIFNTYGSDDGISWDNMDQLYIGISLSSLAMTNRNAIVIFNGKRYCVMICSMMDLMCWVKENLNCMILLFFKISLFQWRITPEWCTNGYFLPAHEKFYKISSLSQDMYWWSKYWYHFDYAIHTKLWATDPMIEFTWFDFEYFISKKLYELTILLFNSIFSYLTSYRDRIKQF
jgi:hypothetical protein